MRRVILKEVFKEYNVIFHEVENSLDDIIVRGAYTRTRFERNGSEYRFRIKNSEHTEESFVDNYSNGLAELDCYRKTVVVETEGDKVRIGLYEYNKHRKVGKKFFSKTYYRIFLTYNKRTNNFYIIEKEKSLYNRERSKIYVNNFEMLSSTFNNEIKRFNINGVEINSIFKAFLSELDDDVEYKYPIHYSLIDVFVKRNGYKGPNNIYNYFLKYYPGKVAMKKNDGNIVKSLMSKLNFKGKYFNKVFNQGLPDVSIMVDYLQILGIKYFKTIDREFFKSEKRLYGNNKDLTNWEEQRNELNYEWLTDNDRKNIVKLINLYVSQQGVAVKFNEHQRTNLTGIIIDHLRIMDSLKPFEPELKFGEFTIEQFKEVHYSCSQRIQMYAKSEEIYYLFDDEVKETINTNFNGTEYKLLENDMDYIEESIYQHNCVRTYADKFNTIIVSARKGKERITMEFNMKGQCIQKRMRFNKDIDESMYDSAEYIENIIKQLVRKKSLSDFKVKVYNTKSDSYTILEGEDKRNYKRLSRGLTFDEYMDNDYDRIEIEF
jgi:hypothetical protein